MKTKLLTAGILAWGFSLAACAADVPMPDNLKAEAKVAAERKVPILLVFTSPHCRYCERVKGEYLGPMAADPAWKDKVIIRQIEAGSDWTLVGFDGKKTTHGAYAASQKIHMVPTVKVVDASGKELAEPIVGLLTPDFYYGYLQAAIEEGLGKINGKK
jgi:thioredoxin-related protein